MYNFYKAFRQFDPRQLSCISHDIDSFSAIKDLQDPSNDLEFQIYVNYQDDLPNPFNILALWNTNKSRFPLLDQSANKVLWMPVTGIDAKPLFSQYKHLLNKQCESLTPENTKTLKMLD